MELGVEFFDRICRACLSQSGNMKSLFTKLEDGHQLIDLLVFTINTDVNGTDGLPKQVCDNCEAFLHKAGEFRRRCIESETILKNIYQNSCENQYFVKSDLTAKRDEIKIDLLDRSSNYTAEECEKRDFIALFSDEISFKKFDQNNIIKTEIGAEYENDAYTDNFDDRESIIIPIELKQEKTDLKIHKCACGQEFQSKPKYKVHLKALNCKHKKVKKADIQPIKIFCQKCNLTFNSLLERRSHEETHHKLNIKDIPQFQCSLCLRKFKTKKTLSKHIKRHETADNIKYTCTKCRREFKYKSFLESHMLSHSNTEYVCEYCPETFTTKKSLEIHKDSHKKRKNVCPFCDKSFLMVCTLKDHLRTHTGEKPFLCSICGKGFSQKTNLAQHVRRHMGVKPFKCGTCSMGFVSKGELDAHGRKHSGAHPFICDACGNGFTTSSALVKHRRTHTGERPYACDLCHMRFAATGTLKNHRRTHTGERPYQCSHCEKSFVQRSDLISHIRCHTGERPFACGQCGQAFRKAAAMRAHVKLHSREARPALAGGPCAADRA